MLIQAVNEAFIGARYPVNIVFERHGRAFVPELRGDVGKWCAVREQLGGEGMSQIIGCVTTVA
jgi:hypothetical protein